MASGRSRVVEGSFIGTGDTLAITKVGFKPRFIWLFNSDDPAMGFHSESMPALATAKQKGSTTSYATANGVTLTATGFNIGADTDLNVSGERAWFVAWE